MGDQDTDEIFLDATISEEKQGVISLDLDIEKVESAHEFVIDNSDESEVISAEVKLSVEQTEDQSEFDVAVQEEEESVASLELDVASVKSDVEFVLDTTEDVETVTSEVKLSIEQATDDQIIDLAIEEEQSVASLELDDKSTKRDNEIVVDTTEDSEVLTSEVKLSDEQTADQIELDVAVKEEEESVASLELDVASVKSDVDLFLDTTEDIESFASNVTFSLNQDSDDIIFDATISEEKQSVISL